MSEQARKAAGVLAQCKWLRDRISKWESQAKGVLAQELSGGERTKAIAMDGTEIGSVTRAEGARSMQIDNQDGFLAWVKQRYPTEVEETVRPAFVRLCAEKVKLLGALPDANGELCPHVSMARAEPKASVSLGDNDKALIEDMFMHRHMPEVMEAMEFRQIPPGILPPQQDSAGEWEVYEGPLEDTTAAFGDPHRPVGTIPDGTVEQPPFIEEGPPNWPESNTFETSDAVHQRRMK
jgi:hypothetical protein